MNYRILFVLSLLLVNFTTQAQNDSTSQISLGGYVKFLQTASFSGLDTFADPLTQNLIHNRLNFKYFPNDNWTIAIEARNRIFYGEQVRFTPNYADQVDQYNGLVDLSVRWVEGEALLVHSIIDRAYVDYSSGKWQARIGRQRINWGVNLVWNPNDLFNAFNFLDFDYEERPGSDAIRLTYYPGVLSSAEVAFSPAQNIEESVGAAMYKFNLKGYDVQVLSGYYRGDFALGAGWAGNLGQLGFKGEATWFTPLEPSADSVQSLGISATTDYLFGNGFYLSGAFLYNSRGNVGGFGGSGGLFASNITVSAKNLFPVEWAFVVQGSGNVTPLFSTSGVIIYSPQNNLVAAIPTLTYSIKENWDIALVGQLFFMEIPQNDFRNLANSLFFRIKWSY
ncbi:MAG: hypothetical protein SF052_05310 [Bacteroidia bacterium]|nr:hypothetical protein [Bacteroidia bacterium]